MGRFANGSWRGKKTVLVYSFVPTMLSQSIAIGYIVRLLQNAPMYHSLKNPHLSSLYYQTRLNGLCLSVMCLGWLGGKTLFSLSRETLLTHLYSFFLFSLSSPLLLSSILIIIS